MVSVFQCADWKQPIGWLNIPYSLEHSWKLGIFPPTKNTCLLNSFDHFAMTPSDLASFMDSGPADLVHEFIVNKKGHVEMKKNQQLLICQQAAPKARLKVCLFLTCIRGLQIAAESDWPRTST